MSLGFDCNIVSDGSLGTQHKVNEPFLFCFAQRQDVVTFLDPAFLAVSAIVTKLALMAGVASSVAKAVTYLGEVGFGPVEAVIIHVVRFGREEVLMGICKDQTHAPAGSPTHQWLSCNVLLLQLHLLHIVSMTAVYRSSTT